MADTDAKEARRRLATIWRVSEWQDRILHGSLDEASAAAALLIAEGYPETTEASWDARRVLHTPHDGTRTFDDAGHSVIV